MNLHNLQGMPVWIWLNAFGGNGTSLGTHLWLLTPDPLPPADFSLPVSMDYYSLWQQQRRRLSRYHPYNGSLTALFNTNGWNPPLCGRRSRSRYPFTNWAHPMIQHNCVTCTRLVQEQGLATGFYSTVVPTLSPQIAHIERQTLFNRMERNLEP